jgi:hypothetical protein
LCFAEQVNKVTPYQNQKPKKEWFFCQKKKIICLKGVPWHLLIISINMLVLEKITSETIFPLFSFFPFFSEAQ